MIRESLQVSIVGGRVLGSPTFHLSRLTLLLENVRRDATTATLRMLLLFTLGAIVLGPLSAQAGTSTPPSNIALERDASLAFNRAEYGQVLQIWYSLPPETTASLPLIRLAFQSSLKLGRPEEAFTLYQRLIPADRPDDPTLLRPLALSFLTSHVRDPQESVRVAAYTILAELGLAETRAVLEDGLLDASVLVRARAADAIGKAGLAGKSGPLRRALNDAMPPVRIAVMNALSEAKVTEIMPYLIEVARTDDGPESVFAYAALYRLGKQDMLIDITGAATLPEPDVRMAALGVLGRLKRPSSLSVLGQGVYDPEPSVRAFAAGALGDYGQAGGVAPLTHALGDEHARVRAVAATSLGRLGIRENQPLLRALTRDASMQVRASAVEGLLRLGDTSAILLAADLSKHPDPSIRAAAAHALSATSDKQAVEILQTLLQDKQLQPRLFAVKALGMSGLPVIPLLKKGLQDSDVSIRLTAAGSLLQQLRRSTTVPKVH
ncbi:MAG: HEAT repeat domain-containing protein [Nitrospirota bacterium]|nr:HEAT repeat domain-containing protein [Nitrospirota bacterium]